jgi:hypothetical protein
MQRSAMPGGQIGQEDVAGLVVPRSPMLTHQRVIKAANRWDQRAIIDQRPCNRAGSTTQGTLAGGFQLETVIDYGSR